MAKEQILGGTTPFIHPKKVYFQDKRPLTTWVSPENYEAFAEIAHSHNVSVAEYLRAVVTDVIADEDHKRASLLTKR